MTAARSMWQQNHWCCSRATGVTVKSLASERIDRRGSGAIGVTPEPLIGQRSDWCCSEAIVTAAK